MKTQAIIKIAIIERRREWRKKLAIMVKSTPGLICTGNYGAVKDAMIEFSKVKPDVVLCNLPPADASEGKIIRALRSKYRKLPILILNLYEDEKHVLDVPNNSIGGCLLKLTFPAKLLLNTQSSDDAHLSFKRIVDLFRPNGKNSVTKNSDFDLTPHELRLLKMLVDGHNHTTAAEILNISYNTVKFHMRRIYQKLEVNSKSAAVAKAMRCGLVN